MYVCVHTRVCLHVSISMSIHVCTCHVCTSLYICPGSPSISLASEEEMERVFSLLSSEKPNKFGDYQFEDKSGYSQNGVYDNRHGNRYQTSDGNSYAYRYSSHEYGSEGGREGQRERGYANEEQKGADNSSSGSSGIDDPYGRRSRSGSAASLHHDVEGVRERADLRSKGSSGPLFGSTDSGIGGAAHQAQGGGEGGRGGDRQHDGRSQDQLFDFSKGLGSLIHSEPHRGYDYHPPMFDMDR